MAVNTMLFDLDGTLINTNPLIISSFEYTLNLYYPGVYSRDDIIGMIGTPLLENFENIDAERAPELVKTYQTHNMEHHDALIEEYEGVKEAIHSLHERGFKLGIVTTKRREAALRGAEKMDLLPYFSTMVAIEDVEHAKPHPQPVQLAMNILGSVPEETIMVGDSQYDILSGQNAGVTTAGVSWTIKGEEWLQTFEPDHMLQDMRELLRLYDGVHI
ncbi:pyrophosphatase PpaX [Sinobaca qinghaiensis]|uniref:Pyrophosphatase PpaX n=1 Tax=Sinobaca qinghaiensis TaxID=342944 RepID=A0A419V9B8_9BACL|nr:pyrophosphatase PpaX [Sinobaca qinghaiensis]RKD76553.1 pyrophosphatase PpaX [Sinobaca qinghaiensis]